LSSDLLERLTQTLGAKAVLTRPDDQAPYLRDWRGYYEGRALSVTRPASAEEVAAVVRMAGEHGVAVVPHGGNTGLCGGATPDESGTQLVLSLERLNRIRAVDPIDYSITVEAGTVLQDIHEATAGHELFFPLDLAAKGSCQIGGNLSTNAGGINVLRYGNARDLVLGLEVVLADGTMWNGLSTLRKLGGDARHYHRGGAEVVPRAPAPAHGDAGGIRSGGRVPVARRGALVVG